jgi:DNA polymerase (family X)
MEGRTKIQQAMSCSMSRSAGFRQVGILFRDPQNIQAVVEIADHASYALSSGLLLRLQRAADEEWGFHLVACTGSKTHLRKLTAATAPVPELRRDGFTSEKTLYRRFGLQYIEPELRDAYDEIEQAKTGTLPRLVTAKDIRGELHAHSLSSDGVDSIEDMAQAARERGYEYIGITDHSQSLKIASGVSVGDFNTHACLQHL